MPYSPSAVRRKLSQELRALAIEERLAPGREDGFAGLFFKGKELAHFHHDGELDIRLGKDVIRREKLVHPRDSTVHPDRASGSPWYELKIAQDADVLEAVRLLKLAISSRR